MSGKEVKELTFEQRMEMIEKGHLFCPRTWFTGWVRKVSGIIFSKEFLVWFLVTVACWQYDLLNKDFQHFVGYLIFSAVFIFAASLRILLETKTEVKVEAKVGASVEKKIQESK